MIRAVIFDMFETLVTHYKGPVYFGDQMAQDVGVPAAQFRTAWDATEDERSLGQLTLRRAMEIALRACGRYSEELLSKMVAKRVAAKASCFVTMDPAIRPMLREIRRMGAHTGLVTNCFTEEADAIRASGLLPLFDAACLSCEIGLQKPDPAIFRRCLAALSVPAGDCLYVGDGGNGELEAASALGMRAIQATWYFREDVTPGRRKPAFEEAGSPGRILEILAEDGR